MRLIFVSRLFSSVKNFICENEIDINGMPTIVTFLSHASRRIEQVEWIIFVSKTEFESINPEKVIAMKKRLGISKVTFWKINNIFSKIFYFARFYAPKTWLT